MHEAKRVPTAPAPTMRTSRGFRTGGIPALTCQEENAPSTHRLDVDSMDMAVEFRHDTRDLIYTDWYVPVQSTKRLYFVGY